MKIERFEEIDAWKNARILVNSVYKVCSSKSSATELQSHLYIACDQNYITQDTFTELYKEAEIIQRQLSNFIKYLQQTP